LELLENIASQFLKIYAKKHRHPVIRHPFWPLIKQKSPEIGFFLQKDNVQE